MRYISKTAFFGNRCYSSQAVVQVCTACTDSWTLHTVCVDLLALYTVCIDTLILYTDCTASHFEAHVSPLDPLAYYKQGL